MKRDKQLLSMSCNLLYYRSAHANIITRMLQQSPKDLTNKLTPFQTLTVENLHLFH